MGKNPSTATVAAPSSTAKSSILKSSFAPSLLQLQLFASVIQSFDCHQLRIHDTSSSRLRHQHSAKSGTNITSLDWGYYGAAHREGQSGSKKRKRTQGAAEDVVVAYGTSTSEVCMYSITEDRIVGKLVGGHDKGVRDFRFNADNNLEGWSLGGDGQLVQWDLKSDVPVRTVKLSDPSVSVLSQPLTAEPKIICASTTPFTIDFSSTVGDAQTEAFDSFKNPIHTLIRSGRAFVAADADRYMNIFDMDQKKLVRTLVTESEVEKVEFFAPNNQESIEEQLLAAVTQDGVIELFPQPFDQQQQVNTNGTLKSKSRNMTRKAKAVIRLNRANSEQQIAIVDVSFQGSDLVLLSVDAGVEPTFQKVRWQDEGSGDLLFEGTKVVVKNKNASTLTSATTNGVKDVSRTHIDDSRTVVVNGAADLGLSNNTIEILSSGDEAEDEEDTQSAAGDEEGGEHRNGDAESQSDVSIDDADAGALVRQGESDEDQEMIDAGADDAEPSFGDMLALRHPEIISIADAFSTRDTERSGQTQLAVPSGMSLGTVLTQALKTNDNNLLETCLHANDHGIIQNTIQRLDSGLAAILLSKLAERLASRPGRYGHLLSWVQWTCIAHGGAIAGQPDVTAKIRTLYKVLNQRSNSLEKLLLLKGKLDMLEAQLEFRKQLQAQRGNTLGTDKPGTIYIEGDDDNWSSGDDHDEAVGVSKKLGFKTKVPLRKDLSGLIAGDRSDDDDDDDDDEMPTTNGYGPDGSDGSDESDSEIDANGRRRQGLVDVEADVSGEDEEEDSETDASGDDEDEEEEQDEDEEDDLSMADFINDGAISEVSDADDIDIDEEDVPKRPATKRSKHKHR